MSKTSSNLFMKSAPSLDIVAAIICSCIGALIIGASIDLRHMSHTEFIFCITGGTVFISSLFYLVFKKKLRGDYLLGFQLADRARTINHIAFLATISLSLWLLWGNLYYRPPIYFVLLLVAAASIILEIFSLDEDKHSQVPIILFKIITLSLILYGGMYYQFPGIFGADPWGYNFWVQESVNQGHIYTRGWDGSSTYYHIFPIFYSLAAITQLLTSLSTYTSVFASTGASIAISGVFVFLIAKKLTNAKMGLLSVLILLLSDTVIQRATAIIAMSLGVIFFLAILYLIFCRPAGVADRLLVIVFSACVIFTHGVAALVMLITIMAAFAGIKLHKKISKPVSRLAPLEVSLALIGVFGVTMITNWMRQPPGGTALFDWSLRSFVNALQAEAQFILVKPVAPINVPYGIIALEQGGYLVLLALALVGALTWLYPRNLTGGRIVLVSIAFALIVVPYSLDIYGIEQLLPGRWLIFSYVPLSILAVQCLRGISNIMKNNTIKLGMVMTVVLAMLFIMTTTNSTTNVDSPLVYDGSQRAGYTQSELTAIRTLSNMGCGAPETDRYYHGIFSYVISYSAYMDMVSGDNSVFISRNYYLHHPEWDAKYNAQITEMRIHGEIVRPEATKTILMSDYMQELMINSRPLIYNNGNVKAYAIW
ncbi:hypothetical protein ACFLYG_00230 [Chloroflexota bacterium]